MVGGTQSRTEVAVLGAYHFRLTKEKAKNIKINPKIAPKIAMKETKQPTYKNRKHLPDSSRCKEGATSSEQRGLVAHTPPVERTVSGTCLGASE